MLSGVGKVLAVPIGCAGLIIGYLLLGAVTGAIAFSPVVASEAMRGKGWAIGIVVVVVGLLGRRVWRDADTRDRQMLDDAGQPSRRRRVTGDSLMAL